MTEIVKVGREKDGEMGYGVDVKRVADLSPNDLKDLLDMIEAARDAVLRNADHGAPS